MRRWSGIVLGVLSAVSITLPARAADSVPSDTLSRIQKVLKIPSTWARVTDASWPSGSSSYRQPDFVLIQDVHRNPEVQSRISSLIVHGYERWGVTKVFMEGAFEPQDLSLFHRIPEHLMSDLIQRLVRDGDLSGPEVAAVSISESEWSNPPVPPFQLFGLEDPQLYRRNVMAYQAALDRRNAALYDLSALRRKNDLLGDGSPESVTQGLILLEKIVMLRVTPQELDVFRLYQDAAPTTPNINLAVQAAIEYYRLARLRSMAFMKNAIRRNPASLTPRIVVVGGFHTEDMAAMLRRERRSFVVLSPVFSSSAGGAIYNQRMRDTIQTYTDALPARAR